MGDEGEKRKIHVKHGVLATAKLPTAGSLVPSSLRCQESFLGIKGALHRAPPLPGALDQ